MDQPAQAPPVDRGYLRPVVGKKSKPAGETAAAAPPRAAKPPDDGDYLVELMPFHVRRGRSVA